MSPNGSGSLHGGSGGGAYSYSPAAASLAPVQGLPMAGPVASPTSQVRSCALCIVRCSSEAAACLHLLV